MNVDETTDNQSNVKSPPPASPSTLSWDSANTLLNTWLNEVKKREESHRKSGRRRRYPAWILGGLTSGLSAATGVSFFVAWQNTIQEVGPGLRLTILIVTFGSAICTALISALRLAERGSRHLELADESRSIRVAIEYYIACPPDPNDLREIMDSLKNRVAALGTDD